jgi:hypothetical protein
LQTGKIADNSLGQRQPLAHLAAQKQTCQLRGAACTKDRAHS